MILLYCHMQHHNDTIIKTQENFLRKILYLLLDLQGFEKVIQCLRVRGSRRLNINCNILTPNLWLSTLCLSRSPDAQLEALGSTLLGAGCWLSLLHLISNLSGPQTPSGFPRASSAGCGFPYHSLSITPSPTVLQLELELSWLLSWLSYIIVQRPLDRPLDLWNRMFNRQQAEITVMQFRGHSLPMRQSMRVSWDFLACPILLANFHPRDFLS